MLDTPEEFSKKWEAELEELTPEERLRMACSMFEFARDLVVSSLQNQNPDISSSELSRQVLLRFYSQDLDPLIINAFLNREEHT